VRKRGDCRGETARKTPGKEKKNNLPRKKGRTFVLKDLGGRRRGKVLQTNEHEQGREEGPSAKRDKGDGASCTISFVGKERKGRPKKGTRTNPPPEKKGGKTIDTMQRGQIKKKGVVEQRGGCPLPEREEEEGRKKETVYGLYQRKGG